MTSTDTLIIIFGFANLFCLAWILSKLRLIQNKLEK